MLEKTNTNAVIQGLFNRKTRMTVHLNRLKIAHIRGDPFPMTEDPNIEETGEHANPNVVETEVSKPQVAAVVSGYNLRKRNQY